MVFDLLNSQYSKILSYSVTSVTFEQRKALHGNELSKSHVRICTKEKKYIYIYIGIYRVNATNPFKANYEMLLFALRRVFLL